MDYVPGYQRARNIFRFAFFVQLAIALLAAMGLHVACVALARRARSRRSQVLVMSAMLLVGAVVAVEAWPPAPEMYQLPSLARNTTWLGWLAKDEQSDVRLIFLPLAAGPDVDQLLRTAEWMYFQTQHKRPMANGYGAVVPADYLRLKEALETFPDVAGIAALREAGITHCVVDRSAGATTDPAALEALGLALAVNDRRAGIEIWALPAAAVSQNQTPLNDEAGMTNDVLSKFSFYPGTLRSFVALPHVRDG